MDVVHKKCYLCQRLLPISEFATCSSRKDGHQPMCRECRKKYDQQRRDKLKASARDRRKALPGVKKFCPGCSRDLPLTSFSPNYKNADGYNYYCRECNAKYQRDKRLQQTMQERRRGRPSKKDSE